MFESIRSINAQTIHLVFKHSLFAILGLIIWICMFAWWRFMCKRKDTKSLKDFFIFNKRKHFFLLYCTFALTYSTFVVKKYTPLANAKRLSETFSRHWHLLIYVSVPILLYGAILLELVLLINYEMHQLAENSTEAKNAHYFYLSVSALFITIGLILLMAFDWATLDPILTIITSLMIPLATWMSKTNQRGSVPNTADMYDVTPETTVKKTDIQQLSINSTHGPKKEKPFISAKHHKTPLRYKTHR